MRQPGHCYSSLNSTIHHRAQKRFAAGNAANPGSQSTGVFPPLPDDMPATAGLGLLAATRRSRLCRTGQRRARSQPGASASAARLADAVAGSPDAAGPSFRRASGLLPGRPGTCHRLACVRGRGADRRRRSGPHRCRPHPLASPAGADRVRNTGRPGFLQPAAWLDQDGGRGPRRQGTRPGRCAGEVPGPTAPPQGGTGARVLTCNDRAIAGCPHPLSPRCRDSGYRVKGKVPNGSVVAPAGNGPAARSRWSSAVCRRPDPLVRTAAASARREPASTTSFLALVTPV